MMTRMDWTEADYQLERLRQQTQLYRRMADTEPHEWLAEPVSPRAVISEEPEEDPGNFFKGLCWGLFLSFLMWAALGVVVLIGGGW